MIRKRQNIMQIYSTPVKDEFITVETLAGSRPGNFKTLRGETNSEIMTTPRTTPEPSLCPCHLWWNSQKKNV